MWPVVFIAGWLLPLTRSRVLHSSLPQPAPGIVLAHGRRRRVACGHTLDGLTNRLQGRFLANMPGIGLVDRLFLLGNFSFGLTLRRGLFGASLRDFSFKYFSFSFSTFAYICVTWSVTFCVTFLPFPESTNPLSSVISNLFISIHAPIHQGTRRVT